VGPVHFLEKNCHFLTFKAGIAPSSIATIAALTPPQVEIILWDEHVSGDVDSQVVSGGYDLVGLTGFFLHLPRAVNIAKLCRTQKVPCVMGGPGVSAEPQAFRGLFDYIFVGEAEYTWPLFLREYEEGRARAEYRQVTKPDLSNAPIPRWDLLQNLATDYPQIPVQTTRGCPFDCDFCDVIYLFGRRPRHRSVEHVLQELTQLEKWGYAGSFSVMITS